MKCFLQTLFVRVEEDLDPKGDTVVDKDLRNSGWFVPSDRFDRTYSLGVKVTEVVVYGFYHKTPMDRVYRWYLV